VSARFLLLLGGPIEVLELDLPIWCPEPHVVKIKQSSQENVRNSPGFPDQIVLEVNHGLFRLDSLKSPC
jgi:hypothetical protein